MHGARLLAKVDNVSEEINLQGLHKSLNYGITTDLTSVVLIGGKYSSLWYAVSMLCMVLVAMHERGKLLTTKEVMWHT